MQPSPKFSCLEGDIWDTLAFPPSEKERISLPSSFQPGPLPLNNAQGTSQSGSGNGALPDVAICQWCVSPLGLVQDSRIPQPLSQALLSTAGSRHGMQSYTKEVGTAFMITSSPSGFNPVQALSQISMGSPSAGSQPTPVLDCISPHQHSSPCPAPSLGPIHKMSHKMSPQGYSP